MQIFKRFKQAMAFSELGCDPMVDKMKYDIQCDETTRIFYYFKPREETKPQKSEFV